MAIPEISNIWPQYQLAMEEFKEVHRSNESAKQDGNKARELRNDIGAIETEIENGNHHPKTTSINPIFYFQ